MKSYTNCPDMWPPLTSRRMNGERNGTKIDGSETTSLNWLANEKLVQEFRLGQAGTRSPDGRIEAEIGGEQHLCRRKFYVKNPGKFSAGDWCKAKQDHVFWEMRGFLYCSTLESHWMRSSSSSSSPLKEKPLHFPPPTLCSFFLQRNNTKALKKDFITSIIPSIPTHPLKIWMGPYQLTC